MFAYLRIFVTTLGFFVAAIANAMPPVDELLSEFHQQGASEFSATAGQAFWNQSFTPVTGEKARRCASCHTTDLRQSGKHITTGKEIKPMAPSVTGKRLTNPEKMRKWLKRNCQWTLGRECTAQEKGDVLTYLKDQ